MKLIFLIGTPFPATRESLMNIRKSIKNQMKLNNDYHIIVYEGRKDDFNFQVLHEKDFKKADLDELKRIIELFDKLEK